VWGLHVQDPKVSECRTVDAKSLNPEPEEGRHRENMVVINHFSWPGDFPYDSTPTIGHVHVSLCLLVTFL
jgi:hypothetical protein